MPDFSVLLTVALPSSGPALLRVARLLAPPHELRVTALHCTTDEEPDGATYEPAYDGEGESPLEPVLRASDDVHVDPVHLDSSDVEAGILSIARERRSDLILMGWHRPMVHDGEAQGPVRGVLERAESDVAVFLARQLRPIRRVLVPFYGGRHDRRGLEIAARIARNTDVHVTVLHVVAPDRSSPGTGLSNVVENFSDGRVRLTVVESDDPVDAAIREAWTGYDLIVAGASEVWGVDVSLFSERLQRLAFATPASLLVVHARSPRRPADRLSTPATTRDRDDGPSGATSSESQARHEARVG